MQRFAQQIRGHPPEEALGGRVHECQARVTVEDLDAGMKYGAGWPMGPCELVDLVGIDVHVHASEALYEKTREPRMAAPPRLVAMRNAGLLGRKSGRGFYTY